MDGTQTTPSQLRIDPVLLHRKTSLQHALKRVLDISLASAAFIFFLPVFVGLYVMVRLQDAGPAIFSHKRVGLAGKSFSCFKFRSMVMDADQRLAHLLETNAEAAEQWAQDQKLRNDPRITPFGHFLRRSSLDELPQLLNIIRGDMSIVGPRPIISDELARYGESHIDYLSVKPGLTGPWQISGRNNIRYNERVWMDAHYAQTWSVWGDVKIILKTIPAVLFARGAS